MEVEAKYIAKDGRRFDDPIECQEYEKKLGVLKGSVGEFVCTFGKVPADNYVMALILIKEDGKKKLFAFFTLNVTDMLEDFVNPENLTEEQRYYSQTVGDMLSVMKKHDQDAPCEFMIFWSDTKDMRNCGIASSHNSKVWEKKEVKV